MLIQPMLLRTVVKYDGLTILRSVNWADFSRRAITELIKWLTNAFLATWIENTVIAKTSA